MTTTELAALRRAAEEAVGDEWGYARAVFTDAATPAVVLRLLDHVARLEGLNAALAERCHGQSEALALQAMKQNGPAEVVTFTKYHG